MEIALAFDVWQGSGMNTYWLSRDGGAAAEGPFAEDQILAMWRHGAITAAALVCLEGTEDWVPVAEEIRAMEQLNPSIAVQRQAVNQARRGSAKRERSAGAAMVLGFLFPGLGHVYAGEVFQGLLLFVLYALFGMMTFQAFSQGAEPLVALIVTVGLWLTGVADAGRAARRFNARM